MREERSCSTEERAPGDGRQGMACVRAPGAERRSCEPRPDGERSRERRPPLADASMAAWMRGCQDPVASRSGRGSRECPMDARGRSGEPPREAAIGGRLYQQVKARNGDWRGGRRPLHPISHVGLRQSSPPSATYISSAQSTDPLNNYLFVS